MLDVDSMAGDWTNEPCKQLWLMIITDDDGR